MSFYFGCYWYNRPESIEDVAAKIVDFLKLINTNDRSSLLENWFQLGYSKKEALSKPIELEYKYVLDMLIKENKLTRKIKEFPFYTEDGFSFMAWNGLEEDASGSISITVGGSLSFRPNCCVLKFDNFSSEMDFDYINKMVLTLTDFWNPFWTIFSSSVISDKLDCASEIGLINYFNSDFKLPKLDDSTLNEESFGTGKLMRAIDERFEGKIAEKTIDALKDLYRGMKQIESNWNYDKG